MDWKIFIFLAVGLCYGQHTCETNPTDNNCYCVLDSTKDTDNWFMARSYCRDEVNGTLVDINAVGTNMFVQNLLGSASAPSAWLGVNNLNGVLSLVSEAPSTAISYVPTWVTPIDASKQCAAMIANDGNWDSLECQGSGNIKQTACQVAPLDQSGNSINTGCPLNAHVYEGKCYQALFLSNSDIVGLDGFTKAIDICNEKFLAGKLILPTSDAETEVIRTLAELTEFDKFWFKAEYNPSGNTFKEYGTIDNYLTYQNWDAAALASFMSLDPPYLKGVYKVVINVNTGDWEYDLPTVAHGVMCVFDVATPTAAVQSPLCPPAPNQASTIATTPVIPSTSKPAVESTPAPTSTPAVETTPAFASTSAVETTSASTSTPAVESTSASASIPAVESTSAPQPTSVAGTTPARIQLQSDESTVALPKGF